MVADSTSGNFFEDFELGQVLRHGTPRTLTEGDASVYIALTGARSLVASASPFARAVGFVQRPIDDWLLFNMAFGKTVPDVSLNAVANLGYAECRFLAPAYPGTTIACESEVIGLRETSGGKAGIVYVRSTCRNDAGEPLLTWVRWALVNKRDPSAPAPSPHIPELKPWTEPSDLVAHPCISDQLTLDRWCAATGSARMWDDYDIGTRIDHPSGMTVEDADHMTAARLYQNNARPHFDARRMAQTPGRQRLAYGGHVISICQALAYDGLENVIGVAAVNAGSHVAPVYGGDTVYASTEVLDRWEVPGRQDVGLLRLLMTGTKESSTVDVAAPSTPPTVLTLDFTVIVPRRIAFREH